MDEPYRSCLFVVLTAPLLRFPVTVSFCGQVKSVQMGDKSADVVFAKESAAKTALMLNGGT